MSDCNHIIWGYIRTAVKVAREMLSYQLPQVSYLIRKEKEKTMTTCFDVASYILKKCEQMPTVKLQKLVYYCQAWSLVWDDTPLFEEEIQAWANGPVIPALYKAHKGKYQIMNIPEGDERNLNQNQKESIEIVLQYCGHYSSQTLSDATRREYPWKNARNGLPYLERGDNVISWNSMAEYYTSLPEKGQKTK